MKKMVLLILLLIAIVAISIVLLQQQNPRGASNRGELINSYLQALTKRDYSEMQQLIPRDYDSNEAIQNDFKQFGGDTFEGITTSFIDLEMDNTWFAIIKGERIDSFGKQVSFTTKLTLRVGQENPNEVLYDPKNPSLTPKPNRWFLLLGKQKLLGPPVNSSPLKIHPR